MILAIIPSRWGSTRFPGKPLADIKGKSMIQRVYDRARKAKKLDKIIVATDDDRIKTHVTGFGGEVIMTSTLHPSGTDRCFEALQLLKNSFDHVINIQGDEPFIDANQIDALAAVLEDQSVELATLVRKVKHEDILTNTNEVKVVLNKNSEALYFSRQAIPFLRDSTGSKWHENHTYYHHIGMYAYRSDILEEITKLPVSSLEKAESLEQLRWLENGYKIKCVETEAQSFSIDTPEDIERVLRIIVEK